MHDAPPRDVELGLVFVIDDYLGPKCEVYWESYGSPVEDIRRCCFDDTRADAWESCRAQFRLILNEMECFLISRKYYAPVWIVPETTGANREEDGFPRYITAGKIGEKGNNWRRRTN